MATGKNAASQAGKLPQSESSTKAEKGVAATRSGASSQEAQDPPKASGLKTNRRLLALSADVAQVSSAIPLPLLGGFLSLVGGAIAAVVDMSPRAIFAALANYENPREHFTCRLGAVKDTVFTIAADGAVSLLWVDRVLVDCFPVQHGYVCTPSADVGCGASGN